jgi:outer membrane lipoprotein-sorting protein
VLSFEPSSSAEPQLGTREGAEWVLKKHEEARKLQDVFAKAKLTTGGEGRETRIKSFSWWRKLLGDGIRYQTLTRFHEPAEVKNEGILFLEKESPKGTAMNVLLYLPNFKKIRRVESQNQSSSFMGSELSYSDISPPHVEDYSYEPLKEGKCPEGLGEPQTKCYQVTFLPKDPSILERTGYSKTEAWVNATTWMLPLSQSYDREGKLWKRTESSEFRPVDPQKKVLMAHSIRVTNVRKGGGFTLLEFRDVKGNQGIEDRIFTQQNLQAVP